MAVERGDSSASVGATTNDTPSTFEQSVLLGTTSTGNARLIVRDATQIAVIDTYNYWTSNTVEGVLDEIAGLTGISSSIQDQIDALVAGKVDNTGDNLIGTYNFGDPGYESGSVLINGISFTAPMKINNFGNAIDAELILHRHSDTDTSHLVFSRARGTDETHSDVQDGDVIGSMVFTGYHSTSYWLGALIEAQVDGTPGASLDMPGRLVLSTSTDGTATPTPVLTLRADKDAEFTGNIEVAGGKELLGLPAVPSATGATSKEYTDQKAVDEAIAFSIALGG